MGRITLDRTSPQTKNINLAVRQIWSEIQKLRSLVSTEQEERKRADLLAGKIKTGGYEEFRIQTALSSSTCARTNATGGIWEALFDASTDETLVFQSNVPRDFASGAVLVIDYIMASATSGGIAFSGEVMCVSRGDAQQLETDDYDSANVGTVTAVPGVAGRMDSLEIPLSSFDTGAAGDHLRLRIKRNTANAADTATGDCKVVGVYIFYKAKA